MCNMENVDMAQYGESQKTNEHVLGLVKEKIKYLNTVLERKKRRN